MATKASKETIISIDSYAAHRDNKGRFVKGNPGGPGRPSRASEQEYLDMLKDRIPPERWAQMVERLISHVEESGSIRAFQALTDRLLGKAPVVVHDDKDDGYKQLWALMQAEGDDDDSDDDDEE